MLNRPSVNTAGVNVRGKSRLLIKYSRGHIQITDVEALQDTVCECYGTVKSYYQALLGPQAA